MRKARGEIKKVADLFEKYRRTLVAPERTVVIAFVEVVEDLVGIAVPPEVVRYSPATRTLSVNGAGPLRAEIRMRRDEILAHMKGRLGERNAPTTIL